MQEKLQQFYIKLKIYRLECILCLKMSSFFFFFCFALGGYYTENLLNQTGFRMLVLNTNLYYDQNTLTPDMDDPAGQFNWADQVLTEAAKNEEKARHFDELQDFNLLLCLHQY